jgi:hypothetical protein
MRVHKKTSPARIALFTIGHRSAFGVGLKPMQGSAHQIGVLPIQEADAEKEIADAP